MNQSKVLSNLHEHNFIVQNSEMFLENSGLIYCYNKALNIGFIVKEYSNYNLDNIMSDVIAARSILRNLNINVWNTYFIILLNIADLDKNKNKYREFYQIERNSKGLRKYLILEESDLYRIPFIESYEEEGTSLNFTANFNEILETKDEKVDELIKWIFSEDGEYKEIQKKNIKEKINEILILEN
ncbi:ABC-three component system middle component 1 [Priestia sp. TGN 0903]|uniref:ABC-three component system middle component 1 n=1 Tax=Priestia sp. TGN 0903 TaxID=3420730 RepID=UPI003D7758B5